MNKASSELIIDVAFLLSSESGLAAPSGENTDYKHTPPVRFFHAWWVVHVKICHDGTTF